VLGDAEVISGVGRKGWTGLDQGASQRWTRTPDYGCALMGTGWRHGCRGWRGGVGGWGIQGVRQEAMGRGGWVVALGALAEGTKSGKRVLLYSSRKYCWHGWGQGGIDGR